MKTNLTVTIFILTLAFGSARLLCAADATWDGSESNLWSDVDNWVGPPGVVPGTGDIATFDGNSNSNTTLDLGAGVTIGQINVGDGVTGDITIGFGGANNQTLTLDDDSRLQLEGGLGDLIFDAGIVFGEASDLRIQNITGSTADIIINGNLTETGSTGFTHVEFGTTSSTGDIVLNGDVVDGGTGAGITLEMGSTGDTTINGTIDNLAGGTTIEVINGANVTVASGGAIGSGALIDIKSGTLTLNSDHQYENSAGLLLGDDTVTGNSTLTLGSGVTYSTPSNLGQRRMTYTTDATSTDQGFINGSGNISGSGSQPWLVDVDAGNLAEGLSELTVSVDVDYGSGFLRKEGNGSLRLEGDNTFNSIQIRSGEVVVASTDSIGSTTGVITAGFFQRDGTFRYDGATATISNPFTVGQSSTANRAGSAIISNTGGGTLTLSSTNLNNAVNAGAARSLTLTGNSDMVILGGIQDNIGAGAVIGAGTVSLVKSGTNTVTLASNSSYTGGTTVSAGTLLVNNAVGSGTGTGMVTVGSGATLGGNGTISGATIIGGNATANVVHTAGTVGGAATQTFGGDLTYNDDTTLTWDLINAAGTAGSGWDTFAVGGELDFAAGNGEINFNIVDVDGSFDPLMNQDFLVWSGFTTLSGFDENDFLISYSGSAAGVSASNYAIFHDSGDTLGEGSNTVWVRFTAVPEPGTFGLMALGLGAFGWVLRRRRTAKNSE